MGKLSLFCEICHALPWRSSGVDFGWWGPFSVKSVVFKTRQIQKKFLLYNC